MDLETTIKKGLVGLLIVASGVFQPVPSEPPKPSLRIENEVSWLYAPPEKLEYSLGTTMRRFVYPAPQETQHRRLKYDVCGHLPYKPHRGLCPPLFEMY